MSSPTLGDLKPEVTPDGVVWSQSLDSGEVAAVRFLEIRRERTGIHALVALTLGTVVLGHDTFNIGRSEERNRLAKAAFGMLGAVHRVAWPMEVMRHDLDLAALQTPRLWDEERIHIVAYHPSDAPPSLTFILKPYLLEGGGTIFFAPPASGKSYILQAMSISIAQAHRSLWEVPVAWPVLYTNLERSPESLHRRERAILSAMGIAGPSNVSYLHARGHGLKSVERKVRQWVHETGGGVMLDSLSRGGLGGLSEDETANTFIDLMNSLQPRWWAAVGHTPRADDDHLFGSVHFDAGEDIGVKVSSQAKDNTLGISLEVVKSNDTGKFPIQYLALSFVAPDAPLTGMRTAQSTEFPDLYLSKGLGEEERMVNAINETADGELSVSELVARTGIKQPNVSARLKNAPFLLRKKVGKQSIYGLLAPSR